VYLYQYLSSSPSSSSSLGRKYMKSWYVYKSHAGETHRVAWIIIDDKGSCRPSDVWSVRCQDTSTISKIIILIFIQKRFVIII
jgi:hypothetical protein